MLASPYIPKEPIAKPHKTPPIAPNVIIGIHDFVMIASGRLRSNPNNNPLIHKGKGKSVAPITKPMANRLAKAPAIADLLSSNWRGIIMTTATIPKTIPQIAPSKILDMAKLSPLP